MEYKVRYFLTSYMQLALKYILIISSFVHMMVMRTHHIFSRACEDAQGKRLRSQTKEIVANVCDYFEEVSRRQQTLGPLKRTFDATGVSHTSIKSDSRGYGNAFSFYLFW